MRIVHIYWDDLFVDPASRLYEYDSPRDEVYTLCGLSDIAAFDNDDDDGIWLHTHLYPKSGGTWYVNNYTGPECTACSMMAFWLKAEYNL